MGLVRVTMYIHMYVVFLDSSYIVTGCLYISSLCGKNLGCYKLAENVNMNTTRISYPLCTGQISKIVTAVRVCLREQIHSSGLHTGKGGGEEQSNAGV